jgi:uncharacterized membrane protein YgdD (TMEM256/DUF423 family)
MNALACLAALSGAVAVGAGAFGAHVASGDAARLLTTGGHYQLVHAVAALIAIQRGARGPGWLFVGGGAVFAGTLYLMALGAPEWLGAITPIGGTAMIAGWLWLAWVAVRR